MQGKRSQFKGLKLISVLVLACTLQGCTAISYTFEPVSTHCNRVYSGTRVIIGSFEYYTRGPFGWIITPIVFVDFPFSFTVDTLLLPYTIPSSIYKCSNKNQEKEEKERLQKLNEADEKKRQEQRMMEKPKEQLMYDQ